MGLLIVSALGCGGKATDEAQPASPQQPPAYAPPPSLSPPRRPSSTPSSPPMSSPPLVGQQPPPLASRPDRDTPEEAAAESILMAYCGPCHGPPLTSQQALGGIWFIDDLAELAERGYIVPLQSAQSRLVQVMREGSMPPRASGLSPLPGDDIDVVAAYIDNPRFWPGQPQEPQPVLDAGAPALSDAGADGG